MDPQRDISQYVATAAAHGLTIERVIETHFHADFLSGHLELKEATGATISYGSVGAIRPTRCHPNTPAGRPPGDVPKRLDAFEAAVKAAGGKLKDVYLVTGEWGRLPRRPRSHRPAACAIASLHGSPGIARLVWELPAPL